MNSGLNQYQKQIVKAANDFAKGEFSNDLALELDKKSEFPRKIWEKAAELGFIGIHFDEAYGGGGFGCLEFTLMAEALCRHDSSMGAALALSSFGAECLQMFGSEELKKKYLSGIAEGEIVCGGTLSAGAQDQRLKVNSINSSNQCEDLMVNGKVNNVVNGKAADIFIITCINESDPINPILLLINKLETGIEVRETSESLGLRMSNIADIEFKDVCVSKDHVIGISGKVLRNLQVFRNESRILMAGMAVGIAQGAFDRAKSYVKQRVQFKKKLVQFQVTRHKLAQMLINIEAARRLTYHAASRCNPKQKSNTLALGSIAKSHATRVAVDVTYEAIQLMGGYGYMTEYDVERYYRDAKSIEIIFGSPYQLLDDISENAIGRVR